MPGVLEFGPQLLSRASAPPLGDDFVHEIKYDGFRLLASVHGGRVRLHSRSGADWTSRLSLIARGITALDTRELALDGELVYLSEDGFPDFERLRGATQSAERGRLYYQIFDLLSLNGRDLTSRPLLERKARLLELLACPEHPRLRYVAHVQGNGGEFFRAVDQLGLEGIVSKRASSVYRPDTRSTDWIKVKCFHTREFAVVGYTTENGLLASLALAGDCGEGNLHYAGRVEFGVPRRDSSLLNALKMLEEHTSIPPGASPTSSVCWVEPRLAAEVRALAWTPGRPLRHAVLRSVSLRRQVSEALMPSRTERRSRRRRRAKARDVSSEE